MLPLTYFFLLPRSAAFMDSPSPGSYAPLPEEDLEISAVEVAEGDTLLGQPPKVPVFLTAGDKWRLVKPMIFKYMLPLCEYILITWMTRDCLIVPPIVLVYTVSTYPDAINFGIVDCRL